MTAEYDLPVVDFHPYRWGDPAHPTHLPEGIIGALGFLGVKEPAPTPVAPEDATLPEIALSAEVLAAFVALLGAEYVRNDHLARVAHTRGFSTPDILKLRAGDASDAPDAVLYPATHDEVVSILQICSAHNVAVVPFAGGTSVVGGLAPVREGFDGVVSVDVRRLDALISLDPVSRLATLGAGVRTPRAEELLGEHGLTLGHFPQSYEGASIGGYAATRSSGQSSAGYGRFDDMVEGLVVATPTGTLELGTAPKSAAGPDLRHLIMGSEGAFGIITSVTLRVHPVPDVRIFEGFRFGSFVEGEAALRALMQDGPLPTVLRLSDEVETALNLADPSEAGASATAGGVLVVVGYEGTAEDVQTRRSQATSVLVGLGGEPLGEAPGEKWRVGRFRGPYLRDPLLDAGALVETLETVTYWSNVDKLKADVTAALTEALTGQGTQPLIMCHISHVYDAGASLYFTVVCAAKDDPVAQWAIAKSAANAAIRAAGASITHHHAVGVDHRETYAQEVGPLAIEMLRAVKKTVDPAGILNPGILFA